MKKPRSPLRIGLLGTGVAANELYLPGFRRLQADGTLEIVACANRRRPKAEKYAKLAGIPKVVDSAEELIALPEVEALVISLPIDLQPRFVLAALKAGKPVLSEKPIGPSVAEAKKLLKAAQRFDVPWLVGENFAFMTHVQKVESWVKGGKLGRVRLVQATQITSVDTKNQYFQTGWRQRPKHIGGFVVDGGVHVAEIVRRCFGLPVSVESLTAQFEKHLPPLDTAVAALRFADGTLGTWTSCFCARSEEPMLRIYGEKANVELNWGGATLTDTRGKKTAVKNEPDSFESEFRHFTDVVKHGESLAFTPEAALDDLIFLDAIVKGPKSRRP
jgi:predicted dehydrogenase